VADVLEILAIVELDWRSKQDILLGWCRRGGLFVEDGWMDDEKRHLMMV